LGIRVSGNLSVASFFLSKVLVAGFVSFFCMALYCTGYLFLDWSVELSSAAE
jgi:hypothetical protein